MKGFKITGNSCIVLLSILLFTSCKTYKTIPYFTDFADSVNQAYAPVQHFNSPVIMPDDLLAITVQTLDPDVNLLLNIPNTSTSEDGKATSTTPVYLVDQNGEVELPFTGKIKLQGATTVEAKEIIRKEMAKYTQNPIINIKFTNFKIVVLGEVTKPDTYVMPTEKVTIFDAISRAGDLTIYGKRENVVLIREVDKDQKTMVHLNLNSKSIFNSPWYFLQPNDIVYVQPDKSKADNLNAATTRNITIGLSALTVLITLISFLRR